MAISRRASLTAYWLKVKPILSEAMEQLAQMPGMGHRRLDVKNQRYRFWRVYSYLIVYFADTKLLQIVPVARDLRRLLK